MSDRQEQTIVTDYGVYAEPALRSAKFVVAVRPATQAAERSLVKDQPLGTVATERTAYLIEKVDNESGYSPLALPKPSVCR